MTFKIGDKVRVIDPSDSFFGWEGVVTAIGSGAYAGVDFVGGSRGFYRETDLELLTPPKFNLGDVVVINVPGYHPNNNDAGVVKSVFENSYLVRVQSIDLWFQESDLSPFAKALGGINLKHYSGQIDFGIAKHTCTSVDVGFNSGKKACKHCDKDM